jgi:membrane protease YdiL (CAAX protease family)
MKTWANRSFLTDTILFILVASSILATNSLSNLAQFLGISVSPFWMEIIKPIHNLTNYLYFSWSFILVGLVIIINRDDLQRLNIDQAFVVLFAAGSIAYWRYYRWPSGWIALLVPVAIYILYKKQDFKFPRMEPIAGQTAGIVAMFFFLGLLLKHDSLSMRTTLALIHLFATGFPFLIVEEVTYRGLLWMFLAHLNWPAPRIVGLQAFLFWLFHATYMFTDPIFFWILVPIFSMILGLIVWRSKSITVSLFAHIFLNFFLSLG